jgi:hypothetical protein
MSRKGIPRDPLLDCPNVKAYRHIVHLQMNYLQRQFVAEKVSCCERGQRIWRNTLEEFMLKGMNPRNVPYMVKIWENQYFGGESYRFQKWEGNGE